MDLILLQILICNVAIRQELARLRAEQGQFPMTPKLNGVASAMAKLRHGLDERADELVKRIGATGERSAAAFAKAHKTLDAAEAAVADVEEFVAGLEGSNGGPSLSGSGEPSGEPQSSWHGNGQGVG